MLNTKALFVGMEQAETSIPIAKTAGRHETPLFYPTIRGVMLEPYASVQCTRRIIFEGYGRVEDVALYLKWNRNCIESMAVMVVPCFAWVCAHFCTFMCTWFFCVVSLGRRIWWYGKICLPLLGNGRS